MTDKKAKYDEAAWSIMLHNAEHDELDRIFAINGVLYEESFDGLTAEEHEDVILRLAIGIQSFNANIEAAMAKKNDLRRLPDVEVSGHEES